MPWTDEERATIGKPRKVTLWGREYTVTPELIEEELGDGKALLWVEPMNSRPDYYILKVDSSWFENGEPRDGAIEDNESEIFRVIEDQCLDADETYEGLNDDSDEPLPWPALSTSSGWTWGGYKAERENGGG